MRLAPLLLVLAAVPATAQEWSALPALPGQDCRAEHVVTVGANPVVASSCGVFEFDSGSWVQLGAGRYTEPTVSLDGTLYALAPDAGPSRYDVGTDAWIPIRSGLPEPDTTYSYTVSPYALATDSGGTLYLSVWSGTPLQGGSRWYESLEGEAWSGREDYPPAVLTRLATGHVAGVAFACGFDPVCFGSTLIQTENGWVSGYAPTEEEAWTWGPRAIGWAGTDDEPAYVLGAAETIYRSADGVTWVPTGVNASNTTAFLHLRDETLAGSQEGLFRSADAGRTWTQDDAISVPIYDLALGADGIGYAVGATTTPGFNTAVYRTAEPLQAEAVQPVSAFRLRIGPNPSRGRASVFYETASAGAVRVEVFDVTGRRVAVLQNGALPAGPHQATLPALPAGTYVVRAASSDGVAVGRAIVIE